jgi:UDPglucose 6-dehydrogenase
LQAEHERLKEQPREKRGAFVGSLTPPNAIKHTSNAFLAMKISLMNAIANISERVVGADIDQIREGVGADKRIGMGFLNAGIGYGGSCFPKDLLAFRAVAREAGYDFHLLDSVMRINQDQRHQFVRKSMAVTFTVPNRWKPQGWFITA